MQAVLLAAGKSSRFYPYNKDLQHKSLVRMMGKTLLEHTLDALEISGVTDIVIVVGKNSPIPQLLAGRKNIQCIVQEQPRGMGDALLCAKDLLQDSFFLLGGYHMDIVDFIHDMTADYEKDTAVVLVKQDEILDRYGNVTLKGDRVLDITEKPERVSSGTHRLIAMYLLSKKFVEELAEIPTEEYHFEKALALFAKKGYVKAVSTEKPTITLKYAWDLLGVKDYLLGKCTKSSISEKAHIAKDAILDGAVLVEDDAKILEGSCVKGPAYIGKGVTIGSRAIVRGGVIVEEKSVIGAQMEIKNAIVMENTTTHAGFIGDSVVGQNTKIAAGIITANARLDRQPVSTLVNGEKVNTGLRHLGTIIGNNDNIGIRVSTMPGVMIGNQVLVGPSTTVMKNVGDNTKYYTKFAEVVEENTDGK